MNVTESFLQVTLLGAEWVLWVLIALSIASVAVVAERLIFFRRRSVDLEQLRSDVEWAIESDQLDALHGKYASSESMPARVALRGIDALRDGDRDAVADAMNSAKTSAKAEHERNLVFLGTLGNNAPFIGLFGTVLGIIKAFSDLASNPAGDANVVMAGISEALVATAVGLLVAIPAVVMFNVFNRRVRSAVSGTDGVALAILGSMGRARVVEMEVD